MKKTLALITAILMILTVFAGCTKNLAPDKESESVTIRLGGLKGPTSMGMVKLLDDAEKGETENGYEFTMAVTADELTPKLIKGELDVLAVPANLGSMLYNNSNGAVEVLAISTLGVIYIVENGGNEISSISDLKDKTIYATGKGTTPEFALNYLLAENGLDPEKDITVEWESEPTEIAAQMATEDHAIAMMPQPFVTVASNQLPDLRIAVDMTAAWDALDNGSRLVTATLIVNKAFADAHPEALAKFLEEYKKSSSYVSENPADAASLVEKYDIVKAPIAEKAIPYCSIVCITGDEMKTALSGYLGVLHEANPKSVGGQLPGDDFYLIYE